MPGCLSASTRCRCIWLQPLALRWSPWFGPSKLTFWRPWQAKGEVIWAGDFGPLPDPDAINTNTDERYLDLIPTDAVIAAAKKVLA